MDHLEQKLAQLYVDSGSVFQADSVFHMELDCRLISSTKAMDRFTLERFMRK
jgi:hypothetical protein